MTARFRLTTNPGLESFVIDEASAIEGVRAEEGERGGNVDVVVDSSASTSAVTEALLGLRGIHHVVRPIADKTFEIEPTLEQLRAFGEEVDIVEMDGAPSFRVACERKGTHTFTSVDAARAFGGALNDRYGVRVDLKNAHVVVRLDIEGTFCRASVALSHKPLSVRHPRLHRPRWALKANVAYAMLQAAEIKDSDTRFLDPFCGSGTMLMEAADVHPHLELHGSDIKDFAVEWSSANLGAKGTKAELRVGDAREIADIWEGHTFDTIVTNPPFGVRIGPNMNFGFLYQRFLTGCGKLLRPGGKVVMLVTKRKTFNQVLSQVGALRIVHVRVINVGGIHPAMFVLRKWR